MIISISKYLAVLRTNWIQALEYRANAIVGLVAIVSGLFIEYQIWDLIFKTKGVSTINGFTFNELIVFIYLSIVVGQLKSSWHTSTQMIRDIRNGDMNKYLIRPISYFAYNLMMFIGVNSLYYTAYTIMLILFVIIFPGLLFTTIISACGFLLALVLSIYLSYCIYFMMICFSFWFGEVRSLVISYNLAMLVLSGQYIPIRFFPKWILNILNWTPIKYLVDFPVSIATGLLPQDQWLNNFLLAISWCIILSILCVLIYKKGIRNYEAYGS